MGSPYLSLAAVYKANVLQECSSIEGGIDFKNQNANKIKINDLAEKQKKAFKTEFRSKSVDHEIKELWHLLMRFSELTGNLQKFLAQVWSAELEPIRVLNRQSQMKYWEKTWKRCIY